MVIEHFAVDVVRNLILDSLVVAEGTHDLCHDPVNNSAFGVQHFLDQNPGTD